METIVLNHCPSESPDRFDPCALALDLTSVFSLLPIGLNHYNIVVLELNRPLILSS